MKTIVTMMITMKAFVATLSLFLIGCDWFVLQVYGLRGWVDKVCDKMCDWVCDKGTCIHRVH